MKLIPCHHRDCFNPVREKMIKLKVQHLSLNVKLHINNIAIVLARKIVPRSCTGKMVSVFPGVLQREHNFQMFFP